MSSEIVIQKDKHCRGCGKDKPRTEFTVGRADCKPCFAIKQRGQRATEKSNRSLRLPVEGLSPNEDLPLPQSRSPIKESPVSARGGQVKGDPFGESNNWGFHEAQTDYINSVGRSNISEAIERMDPLRDRLRDYMVESDDRARNVDLKLSTIDQALEVQKAEYERQINDLKDNYNRLLEWAGRMEGIVEKLMEEHKSNVPLRQVLILPPRK